MAKTAILVDGGFYMKIANRHWGKKSPDDMAKDLIDYCCRHLLEKHMDREKGEKHDLYRIFYYDCPPLNKKTFHPLTKNEIDLGKNEQYKWMNSFLDELKKKRKVALRLGQVSSGKSPYVLTPKTQSELLSKTKQIDDLKSSDFYLNITQKGVDMKIGLDIASLAYKKQVDQIVLIAGDSDFVPAAKLARREGIDFILDPLHEKIKPELFEHIDGLRSCFTPKT